MAFMGYCSIADFASTLAQTLTSASPNPSTLTVPAKLADIGRRLDLNNPSGSTVGLYSPADVYYYLRQAMSIIDGACSPFYVVPLIPTAKKKLTFLSALDEYNDVIQVSGAESLLPGTRIVIIENGMEEIVEIDTNVSGLITTVEPINGLYSINAKVMSVEFPDPIPFICSRLACAMFYDKWSKAQSEPMKSDYATILRDDAHAELNNVREGRTILDGIDRKGARFANPTLYAGDNWARQSKSPLKSEDKS